MDWTGSILLACFWCSAAGVIYTYVGYPIILFILSRVFGRTPAPPDVADADLPRVALLIAAYNEAEVIEQRIRNALATQYPHDRLEVVIASDGSDDATPEICRCYQGRVRTLV